MLVASSAFAESLPSAQPEDAPVVVCRRHLGSVVDTLLTLQEQLLAEQANNASLSRKLNEALEDTRKTQAKIKELEEKANAK